MTSVVLIPWADTDWSSAGRFNARTPLSLNTKGRQRALHWANELASRELAAIYRGDEKTAVQTANLLADRTEVRTRCIQKLKEVNVGLWEGLTEPQVKERFPKVFKRWQERPDSVCPPDGEVLASAADRVRDAIAKIAHKHKNRTVGVVLGPLSLALARCRLEERNIGELRWMMSKDPIWYELDTEDHASSA